MAPNPYRAGVPLAVGDETVEIRLNWEAMGALVGRFGPEWDIDVNKAFEGYDTTTIAEALAIATGREAAFFIEHSPPFIKVRDAWLMSYNLFLFGVPTMEEVQAAAEEEVETRERPLANPRSWNGVVGRLMKRVWGRASFGSRRSMNASFSSGQDAKA